MGLKYQDIETMLREADAHPKMRLIIQHIHAENSGLKQEVMGLAQAVDKAIHLLMAMQTVVGMHQEVFKGQAEGKDLSQIISEMRAEHLSGVVSEEVKQ